MKQDPDKYHSQIEMAAIQFLRSFGPGLTQTEKGHIVTDIAGAASVAGLMLLREVCPQLNRFPPGSVVMGDFLDNLYKEQEQMQRFFRHLARQMGLSESDAWNVEPPAALAPMLETLELTRKLEPALSEAGEECQVPVEYWPHVAGLTTIKLVEAGQKTGLLDETLGKRIATYYLIAGSRTAPGSSIPLPTLPVSAPARRIAIRIAVTTIAIAVVFLLFRLLGRP
jgi:hypothetical protein